MIVVLILGLAGQSCKLGKERRNIDLGELPDTPYNLSLCLDQLINSYEFQLRLETQSLEIDYLNLCYSISTIPEKSDYGFRIRETYFQLTDSFYFCPIEKFIDIYEYTQPGLVYKLTSLDYGCKGINDTDLNHLNLIIYWPIKKYGVFFQTIDLSYNGERFSRMNFIVENDQIISIY